MPPRSFEIARLAQAARVGPAGLIYVFPEHIVPSALRLLHGR